MNGPKVTIFQKDAVRSCLQRHSILCALPQNENDLKIKSYMKRSNATPLLRKEGNLPEVAFHVFENHGYHCLSLN